MERNERLKILRILNGLTQDGLAEKSGLPRGSISIWEKGTNAPSHQAAPVLAAALNVPVGYLMYGTPSLNCGIWQPSVPAPRHLPMFSRELQKSFSLFCKENGITRCANYVGVDGNLYFLGKEGRPFGFLLLVKNEIREQLIEAIDLFEYDLNVELSPPANICFLENSTIDHLMFFFRVANSCGLDVDSDLITSELLKVKKTRPAESQAETKSLIRNAFLHFHTVLDEFEKPSVWNPAIINSRHPTLNDNLSIIFERIYEEIEEKSILWTGEPNKDLSEIIRVFLKGQGFKEKSKTEPIQLTKTIPGAIKFDF